MTIDIHERRQPDHLNRWIVALLAVGLILLAVATNLMYINFIAARAAAICRTAHDADHKTR